MIAAGEAALGLVGRLILDDSGEGRAAPGMDGLREERPHECAYVMTEVSSDLIGAVREPMRVPGRFGQQQQPRRLDRIACDAHDASTLPLLDSLRVPIDNARDATLGV